MKITALLTLAACALLLAATAASAAPRTPVQSCAIIFAVHLTKVAQVEKKAAATFCRKYVPGKLDKNGNDANAILKNGLATRVANRENSLGISSANKISRLKDADGTVVGEDGCDKDVISQLPANVRIDVTVGEIEGELDTALLQCDDRNP